MTMNNYKGFDYMTSKDTYEIYDHGKLTNERISIASGSGIKEPEQRAKQRIDEIVNVLGLNAKC